MTPTQRLQIGHEFCNTIWKHHELGMKSYFGLANEALREKLNQDIPTILKGLLLDLVNFNSQVHSDALPVIQEAWGKQDQIRFNSVIETFAVSKALVQDLVKLLIDTSNEYARVPVVTSFCAEDLIVDAPGSIIPVPPTTEITPFFEAYRKGFMKYKSNIQSELLRASVGAGMKQ